MITKPRILVLAHEQYLNGASHSLITILEELQDKFEFFVIVPDFGLMVDELTRIGVNYKILNLPRCGYFNYSSFQNHIKEIILYYKRKTIAEKKIHLIAQNFLPDLVYTNTSVLSLGYDLSKKIKKPHIWHVREYGNRGLNISYIPCRSLIISKIRKSNVSIFTTNLLKEHWLGQKSNNFRIIYNGVLDHKDVFFKEKNNETITIGIVGIIMPLKKQDFAIQIFNECYKKNPNLRLHIYGEISEQKYYESLLDNIEVNKLSSVVTFLGYVPNSEIYKKIDILMSCCEDEAFGRTLIEAMSHKIPVLSSNSGGPSEILRNNAEFSLYNSIEEAVAKINNLTNDNNFYRKSSEAGFELAMKNFSKESYIQNVARAFNKVINE